MSLPVDLRDTLTIPVISAPMFFVSSARLAAAACVAGVGGSLARHNSGSIEEFESELRFISEACRRASDARESSCIGPLVVNLDTQMPFEEAQANLALIARHGGKIIITSVGNPTSISPMIRDHGMLHFHDVTSMRF